MDFVKGDSVRRVSDAQANVGVVTDVILGGIDPQYEVIFPGSPKSFYSPHQLVADVASGLSASAPQDLLARGEWAGADDFRSFITLAKLETPLADNLYSFAASRTERLPHQFKAVLKLLSSPHGRLLIADEVGLGKTIEAGIIMTELASRGPLNNVLIVCPSPLKEKWRGEMRERFLLDFEVVSGARLREAITEANEAHNAQPLRLIASLELLRRDENLSCLSETVPPMDLVVVDEAHHMRNVGTKTNLLGDLLGEIAETMIFLTATPLNLGKPDFFELMRLLAPADFGDSGAFSAIIEPNQHLNAALRLLRSAADPPYAEALEELRKVEGTAQRERFIRSPRYQASCQLLGRGVAGEAISRNEVVSCQRDIVEMNTLSAVFTRTRKREVQELFPTRRSHTVEVEFTATERRFYDAVTAWTLEEYKDRAAQLVVILFQRMAASCLPALGRRLVEAKKAQRLSLATDELAELSEDLEVAGAVDGQGLTDTDLNELSAELEALSADSGDEPAEVELEVTSELGEALDELTASWDAYDGSVDSKFDAFADALKTSFDEGADRVLVFSYFTGTIDYLAERLDGVEVSGKPVKVLKLYGPMNREQRERAVEEFRSDPGPVVLLSSEVGSEGLDFQFCSRMFNYDLPWNPMRVEQRIGRLDRYGQESELIHILNMIVADTVEERIFYRLYERIKIFEESIGDLEAILGKIETDLAKLQRESLSGNLTAEEQERRSDLIADVIIRSQQENAIFEKESKQFLSNDDVFLDIFNDIARSKRYITPDELRSLVERFLPSAGYSVRLKALAAKPGVFALDGDVEKFRRSLAGSLAKSGTDARAGRAFLSRIDEGLLLTFDPQVATFDRRLEFVSLRHPMIELIMSEKGAGLSEYSCGLLEMGIGGAKGDSSTFFVFELAAKGVKDSVEFHAVVVGADGRVDAEGGTNFLAALDAADEATPSPSAPGTELVDDGYRAAREATVALVAVRERALQEDLDEMIAAKTESLRLSTDYRRIRLRELIETVESESIVRMYSSQLQRLERDYGARLAAIEERARVTVSYRLVAAGLVVDSGESAVAPSSI